MALAAQVSDLVRSAVLHTDMGYHGELVAQFAAARAAAPDPGSWSSAPQRALLLRFLLHAADLSNPCRPPPLGTLWGERVCAEFLAQVCYHDELTENRCFPVSWDLFMTKYIGNGLSKLALSLFCRSQAASCTVMCDGRRRHKGVWAETLEG